MNSTPDFTSLAANETGNDSMVNNSSGLIARNYQFTIMPPNFILAVVYWVEFIVGVAGNLILITVNAWRRSSKQVATQLFITSLAVSDLGLLFAKTWIAAIQSVDSSFKYGRFMCKISNFWTAFAAKASIMLLAALSIDRYLSLGKPGNEFFKPRAAKIIIVSLWLIIALLDLPIFLWFDVVNTGTSLLCTIADVKTSTVTLYNLIISMAAFFFPMEIIAFSYVGIWYKVSFSRKKVAPGTSKSTQHNNKSSRKVARMCAIIVTTFVLTWTPFQIAMIYFDNSSNPALALNFIVGSFALANVNSCVNPIVYGFMWKPMKDAITKVCDEFDNTR